MSGFELPPLMGADRGGVRAPRLIGEGRALLAREAGEGDRAARGASFGGALAEQIERVAALQSEVSAETEAIAKGESVGVDKLMMSIGKSEVAFNLMLEVRNKLVDAWEKLSRSVV
ncbi:MAG: hypothetical protein Fur0037_10080 [Planctomycetota bacterium]